MYFISSVVFKNNNGYILCLELQSGITILNQLFNMIIVTNAILHLTQSSIATLTHVKYKVKQYC